MTKSLASLENDFSKIRAGRAHPSLLEQIQVDYYGSMVPFGAAVCQWGKFKSRRGRTKVSQFKNVIIHTVTSHRK
jgi:hypothetical protein